MEVKYSFRKRLEQVRAFSRDLSAKPVKNEVVVDTKNETKKEPAGKRRWKDTCGDARRSQGQDKKTPRER